MADLKTELTDDTLGRGYAGMSDQAAADDLNTAYRSRDRQTMTASEVANAIDLTELTALSAEADAEVWRWLSLGTLNPFGVEATRFTAIFGAGNTIAALQAARVEAITRAQELGLGTVKPGHVEEARR